MSNIDKQALVIPQREKHDWSQAVMRPCDFCQQWALTVRHSDGGCICASCCDSEYTTALSSALVVALDELEAKDRRIAELQISRDKCFLSGLKTGWEYGIANETEGYNREIADGQAVVERAVAAGKGE
ncbi:TPA: hypothetical protein ACQZHX_002473 [Enterobacter sichuanensis]